VPRPEILIPLSVARRDRALLKAELRGERRATLRLLKSLGVKDASGHIHGEHGRFAAGSGVDAPTAEQVAAALQAAPVMKGVGPSRFGCAMVPVTGPGADALLAMAARVADSDLADDGREDEPHVTVRYGLHTDDAREVAAVLADESPVSMRLGEVSIFPGAESGKDYDVLKVTVEGDDLPRIHAKLGTLPHTDTHSNYKPHATIAYVKAGLGERYAAEFGRVDADATADRVTYSTADKLKTTIPLRGGPLAKAVPAGDADDYGPLYEAALEAVIHARETGDDDAVAGIVEAYREHLDTGGAIHKAGKWDTNKHPRDDHGRFVSRDAIADAKGNPEKEESLREKVTDPEEREKLDNALAGTTDLGRTKAGQRKHEAGQRRAKRAADHARAGEIADKIGAGTATHEEMHELGDHLEGLTVDKLRALQSRIPTAGRTPRKADMVAALRESLERSAHAKRVEAGAAGVEQRPAADHARLALAGMQPNRYDVTTAGGEVVPAGKGYQRWEGGGRAVGYTAEQAAKVAAGVTPDHADRRIAEHEAAASAAGLDDVQREYHATVADQLRAHKEAVFGGAKPVAASLEPAAVADPHTGSVFKDRIGKPIMHEGRPLRYGDVMVHTDWKGRESLVDVGHAWANGAPGGDGVSRDRVTVMPSASTHLAGFGRPDSEVDLSDLKRATHDDVKRLAAATGGKPDEFLRPHLLAEGKSTDPAPAKNPLSPTPADIEDANRQMRDMERERQVREDDDAEYENRKANWDDWEDKRERMEAWERDKPDSLAARGAAAAARGRMAPPDRGGSVGTVPAAGTTRETVAGAQPIAPTPAKINPGRGPEDNGPTFRPVPGATPGKPVRHEAGKKLTPAERDEVLRSVRDVYREKGHQKDELKGYRRDSGDPIYGYAHAPEHFERSDITGAKVRHYVTLPDGRKAHPSELYPEIKQSDIDRHHGEQEAAALDKERRGKDKDARAATTKGDANSAYQVTRRPMEGSYFVKHPDGRIARVDGTDLEDVEHYQSRGFEPVTAPITAPATPKAGAPATDPHLAPVLAAHAAAPEGSKLRDYLDAAVANASPAGHDASNPPKSLTPEQGRRLRKELASAHADAHQAGNLTPEDDAAFGKVMQGLGVKPLHEVGATVPFDPATMESSSGVSTGAPVTVGRRGRSGLYGDAKTGHENVGNNVRRAVVAPAAATVGKPTPPEKPVPAAKPARKPKADTAATSGYGQSGADHPLAGLDRESQWKRLGHLSGDSGEADRERLIASGPPKGLNLDTFNRDVHAAIAHADDQGLNAATAEAVYDRAGKKHGLTKAGFVRAMAALHNDEDNPDRMGRPGASQGTDLLAAQGRDPELMMPDSGGAASQFRLPRGADAATLKAEGERLYGGEPPPPKAPS